MKIKRNLIFALFIITGCCFHISCGKDGEDGNQGPAGTNGTVFTMSHAYIQVTPAEWIPDPPGKKWRVNKQDSIFTANAMDSALIMVYNITGNSTIPLPNINTTEAETFAWITMGTMEITVSGISGSLPPNPSTRNYHVIIAYPILRMAHPDLNWNDYQLVKSTFNLQD